MQLNPYALPIVFAAVLLIVAFARFWPHRATLSERLRLGLIAVSIGLLIAYICELMLTTVQSKNLPIKLEFTLEGLLPLLGFLYAVTYTTKAKWLKPWVVALMAIIPVVYIIMSWVPVVFDNIMANPHILTVNGYAFFVDDGTNPDFNLNFVLYLEVVYLLILYIITLVLLIRGMIMTKTVTGDRKVWMLFLIMAPFLGIVGDFIFTQPFLDPVIFSIAILSLPLSLSHLLFLRKPALAATSAH